MSNNEREHRNSFAQFLRQGLHNQIIPGGFTYDQIRQMFNIPITPEPPVRGFTYAWFQDLYFWFDDNGLLTCIGIQVKPLIEDAKKLSKVLNLSWTDFANQLTPSTFEELVIAERIPCLKATAIVADEEYSVYCLDHIGMMPRFEDEGHHNLYAIDIALLRGFPQMNYETIWPHYEPDHLVDWPSFSLRKRTNSFGKKAS